MSTENTSVETVDMDLDSILNVGSSNIMLPAEEKAPNIFERKTEDLSFLNRPIEKETKTPDTEEDKKTPKTPNPDMVATSSEIDDIVNNTEVNDDKTSGRPKLSKDALIELTNKLIEKKLLVPFEDEKKIEDYTINDFEELFEANTNERERKVREQIPAEFFSSLPEELQYAAKYVSDGGKDLKGLFRTLAAVEEVRTLDPSNEEHQKYIVRSYLQATQPDWTPDEIEEEIVAWEDRDELEAKANKFKPKLDALSEKQVQYQLRQQEALRQQQNEQAQMYMDNVYKTLEPGELNGLKLDKKTQNLLFSGLVQPAYQSANGRQTNLLGHLLEKYQYAEPNHSLIAEALWLLSDPDGYRSKVKESGKKEAVAETVRKLKQEEGRKIASHVESDELEKERKTQGITRPSKGFFARKF